jgi:hypothetical protein
MTRIDFGKSSAAAAIVLAATIVAVLVMADAPPAQAQQIMKNGDILTGQLNAMRGRAAKGKRVNTYQLVSEPRRLPAPSGLCNLETGPETFQIVAANDAEAAKLKGFVGKEISLKVGEVACAEEAGQMSEAVVTKWSVVGKP